MKQAVLLQFFASLLMFVPLLFLDTAVFAGNSDALFYTNLLKLVGHYLSTGHGYLRWLPEANAGLGSPVLLYYSPLAYQITALIGYPIASLDPLAWKRLLIGMFFAQWIAGVFTYMWLRHIVSPRAALMASLLFTVFPYKFIYMFLHVNLVQLWALPLLPLLMLAAHNIAKTRSYGGLLYAVALGLLIMIHPRTLVAFAAVPALYALIFSNNRRRTLMQLLGAHGMALTLAATYLLPALLNLDLVQASLANMGRMDYASNLSHIDLMLNFHYAIIATLALAMLSRLPGNEDKQKIFFFSAVLAVVAVLCMKLSKPLWDALTVMQFLQFPAARFHAVALIAATALAALIFEHAPKIQTMRWVYSSRTVWIAVIVMAGFTLNHVNKTYEDATGLSWNYVNEMHRYLQMFPPEYQTHWQNPDDNTPDVMERVAGMKFIELMSGAGSAYATFDDLRSFHVVVRALENGTRLRFHQLFLPQWKLGDAQLQPDSDGWISITLPRGNYDWKLLLTAFPGEIEGNIISLISLALCIYTLLRLRRRARSAKIATI